LPILFVTLGLGSVIASAVSAAPWLAVISRHKNLMFSVSGALLALNYWLVVVRPQQCGPGELCHMDHPLMRWNHRVWRASAAVYAIAFVLTYGSLFILKRL
jgi:hypothetical protein